MYEYELMFIVRGDAEQDRVNEITERITSDIKTAGGQVNSADPWGRRRLAYPINKQRDGQYVLVRAQIPAAHLDELDRTLKLMEDVLRHMVVKADDGEK